MINNGPTRSVKSPILLPKVQTAEWLVISVLLVFYVFSFIDRTIISMLVGPLKADLKLSDFQLSLLMGPAFAIFYIVCGLPIGWLVDRMPKRLIIAGGVAIWGLATCLSAFASSFGTLVIGRTGVGVGESALTPAAHAILAERIPRSRLATAMSIFTMGAVIGTAAATAIGGLIVGFAEKHGPLILPIVGALDTWQQVFFFIGLATLLVLPLTWLLGRSDTRATAPTVFSGYAVQERMLGFGTLVKRQKLILIGLPIGFGFTYVLNAALGAWTPAFMTRTFGWSIETVGAFWGVQHLIAGVIGQIVGAIIVDRMYARGIGNAHVLYHMIGLAISVPMTVLSFQMKSPTLFLVLSSFHYLLAYPFVGYAAAAVQLFTPNHLRGRVSAMFLAIMTIIGTTIGAPMVGWITDEVFGNPAAIGNSLSIVTLIFGPLAFVTLWVSGRQLKQLHSEQIDPNAVFESIPI